MFIDFERATDVPFTPDICVVGAGIAGLTLVSALRQRGLKVLVLEGGGLMHEPRGQSLFETEMDFTGPVNVGVANGRFRVFGGTGTRWSGHLIPLAPQELSTRPTTDRVAWPIDYAKLAPYFSRLDTMLGLNGSPFDATCYQFAGRTTPALASDYDTLSVRFSKTLPWRKRDIGRFLGPSLKKDPDVVVFYHANAVELVCGERRDVVTGVRVRSYTGREQIFAARQFIIAAGAIESVRLLLVSHSLHPDGMGDRWKLLGCGFNDHLVLRAGVVTADAPSRLRRVARAFYIGNVLHTPRFELSQHTQAEEECLSGYANIFFEASPESAFVKLRTVLSDYQERGVRALSRSPYWTLLCATPDLVGGFLAWSVLGLKPISGRSTPTVYLVAEQPSRRDARIRMAEDHDAVGMPRLALEWQIGDAEQRTLTVVGRRLEALLRRNQIGAVIWFDEAFDPREGARLDRVVDQYHHAGGARMSALARDGVVDADCRVHDMQNLYLASAAVFPSSGCSNPTFTIMALALRLAEYLQRSWQINTAEQEAGSVGQASFRSRLLGAHRSPGLGAFDETTLVLAGNGASGSARADHGASWASRAIVHRHPVSGEPGLDSSQA
jgi:choline dehydrogenase-like flavoprotein